MSHEKLSVLEALAQELAENGKEASPETAAFDPTTGEPLEAVTNGHHKPDRTPSRWRSFWKNLLFAVSGYGVDQITLVGNSGAESAPSTVFPKKALVGSLGDLAIELSKGTEVPEEFIFATALTCVGAMASGELKLEIGMDSDTRLYTVLLGKSYSARKSSAMSRTIDFFRDIEPFPWKSVHGLGSAEGLAMEFTKINGQDKRILLAYDELRAFVDKTKIKASVLLPMVTSLFEGHSWDNLTKASSISVRGARLSLVGCCTVDTYAHLWTPEAIAIGLVNRLFLVDAEARPKIAWPRPPDEEQLNKLKQRIQEQLKRVPRTFQITSEGRTLWETWYYSQKAGEHNKRLDTIGFRLMPILALTMDKDVVDLEIVEIVIAILDYEQRLRVLTDPIDAETTIARLEEAIRRNLKAKGRLTKRSLRQAVHADRVGLWAFMIALENLRNNGDIVEHDGEYQIAVYAEDAP